MSRVRNLHKSKVLQATLWLAPLAAVVYWATMQQAPKWPDTQSEWAWLAGALVAYAVVTLMRGERWHSILWSTKIEATRSDVYGLTVVGYAGNNALPARGGELLRVFLLSSRTDAKRRTVIGTILAERILDAIALGGILLVVAYDLIKNLGSPSPLLVLIGLVALGVLALAAAYAWWRHRHHAQRLLDAVLPILLPLKPLLSFKGVVLLAGSVLIWLVEASVYGMIAESVDIHLGVSGSLSVVAFANLAALVPGAPGSIGTYDLAVGFATKAVTHSSRNVVSFIVLLRFVVYVPITIAGGLLLFFRYGGLDRLRAARQAGPEDSSLEIPVPPLDGTSQGEPA
jgi:uncharacterized membrane protein YbhN (UPF0104 family)